MTNPMITRYRKRPIEVDTIQWTGTNEADVQAFTGGPSTFYALDPADRENSDDSEATATVYDKLRSTWVLVYTGQHIVRGVKGEYYPIAEDVLAETYEPVTLCQASSSAPNALGDERCTLPAGHEGRHADGTLTWPAPAATEATDRETTARVFAALHRSAEQDVIRVIALYERWVKAGPPPLGASMARWWDARLIELHNAIRPPTDQTTEK
ncbi:hypothetical protein ABZ733_06900 [Streptomyces longwoodensis]|uniref:hypothetical protein n=1 Tax=Streptomyces longwoodensis TaxID=68231 RepID=UPI0033FBDCFA